jgi:hypothetical protein
VQIPVGHDNPEVDIHRALSRRPAKEVMKHNLHLAGRVDPSSKKQLSFPIKRNFLLTGLDIGQA